MVGQEAVAYIAGAVYARNIGVTKDVVARWSVLHRLAGEIAEGLGHRNSNSGVATVTCAQYYPLRQALLASATEPDSAYYGLQPTDIFENNG